MEPSASNLIAELRAILGLVEGSRDIDQEARTVREFKMAASRLLAELLSQPRPLRSEGVPVRDKESRTGL